MFNKIIKFFVTEKKNSKIIISKKNREIKNCCYDELKPTGSMLKKVDDKKDLYDYFSNREKKIKAMFLDNRQSF